MKTERITQSEEALFKALDRAMADTKSSILVMGKAMVAIVDGIPDGYKKLREKYPSLSGGTIAQFLRVGRGHVYEPLLLSDEPGVKALRKCDIAIQKEYYHEPIPVLIM